VEDCATLGIAPSTGVGSIRSSVRIQISSPEGDSSAVTIAVAASRPHFGGVRPWYAFPRCGRRAGRLYVPSFGVIGCRVCLKLVYRSQYRKDSLWAAILRRVGL
jgi:hypothetical protein